MTPDERLLALAKAGRVARTHLGYKTDSGWFIALSVVDDYVTVGGGGRFTEFPAPKFRAWADENLPKDPELTPEDALSEMEKAA